MLFSSFKWNNGKEISPYVPASASLSFEKMEHALGSAENMFLLPLLGRQMLARLQRIYDGRGSAVSDTKKLEDQALDIAKRAEATIAFWWHFDALNLRVTDQGFQRQQSDDWSPAFKYQEDRLRANFKRQGFNSLDALVDFLADNISTFDEFQHSDAYVKRQHATVKNREEAEQYVSLGHSTIAFLRLEQEFTMASGAELQAAMGADMYDRYREWMANPATYPPTYDVTLDKLRTLCVPVVVFAAAKRLLERTGTYTDRGLYFEAVVSAAAQNNQTSTPASERQIGDRLGHANRDLQHAQSTLKSFLRRHYTDIFSDDPGNVIRDNDDHAGFFAM